ncbi:unnamed protein product, partial [marine sediment metagenome]
VYSILDNYGIRLYRDVIIEEENYASEGALELIPEDLLKYINENVLKTKESSKKLSITTDATWFVDGVPYSDDAEVVKYLTSVIKFMDEGKNLEAVKVVERCRILTMAPKERMIFSGIAGNCYRILGKLSMAENYFKDALKISERRDLQEIYKEDLILTRAATLGNIGLIYGDKGDLDKALEHYQEALKICREIGYKRGEANGLGNIGNVYIDKGDLDKALEHYQEALKIHRGIGDKVGEANGLGNIGNV